ncbi:MAG: hypothetical protein RIE86_09170 [Imperialibacter sp.]|uniref:hypothetical protein n=1 Tax=Imperialibacter sp. TaxID=2038411 RepID=UPI0032EDE94D
MKPKFSIYSVVTSFLTALLFAVLMQPVAEVQPLGFAVGWLAIHAVFVKVPTGSLAALSITDTSYAGKFLDQWIAYASTQFDTLKKGCLNVLPGIKKKQTIPILRVDSFIQAHQPTPTHGGNIDVDARTLEPETFMGYLEFLPRKFEQHWKAVQMAPKLLDAMLPKSAESAIIQKILQNNDAYLDKAIWQGEKDDAAIATAVADGLGPGDNNLIFMDGFQMKAYQDDDVLKVAAPVALTSSNIFDKLAAVAALFPNEVYEKENFKFLLSGAHRQAYTEAQQAQPNKGPDKTQSGVLKFDGKPIELINGMSANTIVGGRFSRNMEGNLWLGLNEVDEEMYLHLKQLAANSEYWFIKMLFKMDVNYGLSEELGIYMTETYD